MKWALALIILIIIVPAPDLSAQVTGLAGWNIYLDPGHSQKENMGIYGYSEAEKVLRVGLALREMLLSATDIDTVYISRTNDQQNVQLVQRTDHANSVGAAWYHSIHSDASMNPSVNSTLLLWGQYQDGREKIPNGGKAISAIIIGLLTRGMRTATRGSIGDCSFYSCNSPGPYLSVNRRSTMPSELSEAGFHTNPKQNQLNMNADWKKLEAKALYWALLQFHDIERPAEEICAGIVSDLESGIPLNGARIKLDGQTYVTDSFASLFHQYTNDPNLLHNGFYYFENIPKGMHQMIVEADHYKSDTVQVVVSDTFFTFKDPKLKKALVDVKESVAVLPKVSALHPNYPNPFWSGAASSSAGNPETTIRYQIAGERRQVTLIVYDVTGKAVKNLMEAEQAAGDYGVLWDGKDDSGQPVASGIYFYKLIAGDFVQIKRMVLVR